MGNRETTARSMLARSMMVTGAARGLGAAIALAAAQAGYRVAAVDVTEPDVDTIAAGDLTTAKSIIPYQASVVNESDIEVVLSDFGVPDVVVNNAGIVRFGPLVDLSLDDFREVLDVNLVGTFVVARAVAAHWISDQRPGCIVNVTSMNGVAAGPNAGAYGASKAGAALLTSQMALEWGASGIRVNAVAPGLIDAGMSEPIYADAQTRAARESRVPVGRLGVPADIADVVLFLASDKAAYIHGQNILVDGGVTGSVIQSLPRPAHVDAVGHAE